MSWYLGHFPTTGKAEAVKAQIGVRGITGESSPYYMFHPLAGQRIARDLPSVKLLVLLRDPVERAYPRTRTSWPAATRPRRTSSGRSRWRSPVRRASGSG
ncbi:hypothetical protein V2I01_12710 [Micromonospora sp. BRA006-A]|nr:hypothetical protein [Micromonospora sp. BRA006-A]